MQKIRLILADDHPILLKGMVDLINEIPEFQVIATAHNGKRALEIIENALPDIAIVDYHMPEMNGGEVIEQVNAKGLSVKMILLTLYKEEMIFNKVMSAGVLGYILKENSIAEIVECIRSVAKGQPYVSPSLMPFLLKRQLQPETHSFDKLTKQEKNILKLIARKKTSREIAEMLFISPKTVENHRSKITKKLGIVGKHNALVNWVSEHSGFFQ